MHATLLYRVELIPALAVTAAFHIHSVLLQLPPPTRDVLINKIGTTM